MIKMLFIEAAAEASMRGYQPNLSQGTFFQLTPPHIPLLFYPPLVKYFRKSCHNMSLRCRADTKLSVWLKLTFGSLSVWCNPDPASATWFYLHRSFSHISVSHIETSSISSLIAAVVLKCQIIKWITTKCMQSILNDTLFQRYLQKFFFIY